jgi:peptidyl-prolyl cis-trans isomerase D
MLKVMRDSFKHLKWILLLIVAAFVFMVFAQWGAGGASGTVSNVSFVASVNGDAIGVREYSRTMYFTEKQYEQAYGTTLTPEMRDQLGLTQLVLNSLIDQKLLLQQAARLHLDATPEEVRDYILKMPVLNPDGAFVGEELYLRYVTGNLGYPSTAAFEDDIEQEITLSKINSALLSAVMISPARAEQEFRRRNENASIRYVLLPTDRTLGSVEVSAAEVEQYYRENTARYTHPEQRNVNYLLADMARVRSQITIPEADLRARYEASKANYRQPEQVNAQHILVSVSETASPEDDAAARAKAQEALQKARSGADFAELVREYSDEPGAAERAGDLGFFGRGQMVPEFEQAAFSMQPGQISDLVRTQFGYHVIKLNEKRTESVRSFEEARPEIEANLLGERGKIQAREAINSARTRLEQLKPVTPEKMESVTGQLVTYNAGGWFGKTESVPGLGRAPAINDWAFGPGAVGETSQALETPRGPAVAYLVGARPAGVYPLEEIRARVENDAKLAKAREAAKQELAGMYTSLRSVDAIASTLGVPAQDSAVNRATSISGLTGWSQELVDAAMTAKQGETVGPIVVDEGAVLFTVVEPARFDPSMFEAQKESLIESLRQTEFRGLRASLIAKLREGSEIAINQELLQSQTSATTGM